MRVVDLLRPYGSGVSRVVDASGHPDVSGWLPAPVAASGSSDRFGPGDLVVTGPDLAALCEVAGRLDVGAQLLVLDRAGAADLCLGELLDVLGGAGCQIRQVAAIDTAAVRTALVAVRTDRRLPLRDHHGAPVPDEGERTVLRVVNEHLLSGYAARAVHARLRATEGRGQADRDRVGKLEGELAAARQRAEEAGRRLAAAGTSGTELSRQLRAREEELRAAHRRVAALERSISLRVGRALVDAARDPRRTPGVARELVRTWRRRGRPGRGAGAGRATAAGTAAGGAGTRGAAAGGAAARTGAGDGSLGSATDGSAARPAPAQGESARFLAGVPRAARPRERLAVAGVLSAATAAALAPDSVLTPLVPHAVELLLEAADPDLVLIEAGAGRPGGSWAHLGTPYAADHDLALLRALRTARARGCPVVFCWDVPAATAPGLTRIAEACDVVLGPHEPAGPWSRGVQLAVHSPLGAGWADRRPLLAGGLAGVPAGQRAATQAALRALLPHGLRILAAVGTPPLPEPLQQRESAAVRWERTAEVYRSAAVAVCPPYGDGPVPDLLLEQLACGTRLVGAVDPRLAAIAPGLVTQAGDADALVAAATEAGRAGRPAPIVLRRLLRELAGHTTRARLSALARLVDAPVDPAGEGAVAVVVDHPGAVEAGPLVRSLLAQRRRPDEVVLAGSGDGDAAAAELAAAGVRVRRTAAGTGIGDTAATSPWLVPGTGAAGWEPEHLLDLTLAAQLSGADAVGVRSGPDLAYTSDLPLASSMLRRSTAERLGVPADGDLAAWSRRGATLFALDRLGAR